MEPATPSILQRQSNRHKCDLRLGKEGTHETAGFPSSAYGMSKLGLIAVSEILAKALSSDVSRPDIVLNSVRHINVVAIKAVQAEK